MTQLIDPRLNICVVVIVRSETKALGVLRMLDHCKLIVCFCLHKVNMKIYFNRNS